MHWDKVAKLSVLPDQMTVLVVGGRRGSFIARCVWIPTIRRFPELIFRYAQPSRDKLECARFAKVQYLPRKNVSHDFDAIVCKALKDVGAKHLIVCIAAGTSHHARLISRAAELGVRFVVCDKPATEDWAQLKPVLKLAKKKGMQVWITFNHRFNAAVHWLKAKVAGALTNGIPVHIEGCFDQSWLNNDTGSQQALSRIGHPNCTLNDLGTHVFDVVQYVAGSPILGVKNATVSRGLSSHPAVITGGRCTFDFGGDGKLTASGSCDQCKPGEYTDGIDIVVSFGEEQKARWQMTEGGGDSLLLGSSEARVENRGDWKQIERGTPSFGCDDITQTFSKNPPGHGSSDWENMWWYMFSACLGKIWTARKLAIRDHLEPHHKLPMPTLEDDGRAATLYVEAHVKSAANDGMSVTLEEMAV